MSGLHGFNVNQLVALDALLRERSVRRAARRMGVTQSAMSHTLRQLRETLGDPLLVRVGNEMEMSPRAESLAPRLRKTLEDLEAIVIGRDAFDPHSVRATFSIATSDGPASVLVGPLYAALSKQAPNADLSIAQRGERELHGALVSGDIDVALVPPIIRLNGLQSRPVMPTGFRVAYRRGHPTVGKRLTLKKYCSLPHVVASLSGGPSFVDHLLAERDAERRVAVRVPYLFAMPDLLERSNLLATIPTLAAKRFSAMWKVDHCAPPFSIAGGPLLLVWHERFEAEPAHRFFRELVAEVADQIAMA